MWAANLYKNKVTLALIVLLVVSGFFGFVYYKKTIEVAELKKTIETLEQKNEQQQNITRAILEGTVSPTEAEAIAAGGVAAGQTATVPAIAPEPLLKGELTGIYQEYMDDWWQQEAPELKPCTAFEVISGDDTIIKKYTHGSGKMVLNLPWSELSSNDQAKIKAATPEYPVTLIVEERPPTYTDAGSCYPFFLVSVK